ncbi:MAG: MATE family efflux transporter [Ruminococcaceae bacterium]|nr:MATE family efflux transporter [Oscillospiraceae bacterium]
MIKKVDATEGPLTKLIFIYTIPLILASIMQNLFNIADQAVLGNMAGTSAVASIAATSTVSSLIISGAVGLSAGTTIVLARFVGQKDKERIRKTIDTSVITSILIGLIVAVAGVSLAPFFLDVTKCPKECYSGALLYMRIVISAAPATLLYNYGASILRALGDSQRPLIYILIAGVVNVSLNVILCLILPQKVVAVAIATVASKIISAWLVFRRLCRLEDGMKLDVKRMRFDFQSFRCIFRFGIPASISQLVLPIGNLQIATAINTYGYDVLAGHSASISIETIGYAFSTGFSSATLTFMGQNIGAGNVERVRQTFWKCFVYSLIITGSIGVLTYITGEIWLGLIVGSSSTVAIKHGMLRLSYVALFMFINAISNVLISSMKAFGYPMLTSITNIVINLGFRVFWMQFIYPLCPKFVTIMQCYTVAWLLNLLFYAIFGFVVYRRYVKKGICKEI